LCVHTCFVVVCWDMVSHRWVEKPPECQNPGQPGLFRLISSSSAQSSLYVASPQKGCTGKEGLVNEFLTSWFQVSEIFLLPNHYSFSRC
jgi:hypothetical protein